MLHKSRAECSARDALVKGRVSVVIPTYNRRAVIKEAVVSVLGQTYSNVEVIIVDDGSTDDTANCLSALDDERVCVIRLAENSGVSYARNVGIRSARGEFVAFLDSDDLWEPDKLQRQVACLEASQDVALVSCDWSIWRQGKCIGAVRHSAPTDIYKLLSLKFVCAPSTVLVRKNVLNFNALMDTQMSGCEDADLWIRLAAEHGIDHIADTLVSRRTTAGSLGGNGAYQVEGVRHLISKNRALYLRYGLALQTLARWKIIRRLLANSDFQNVHDLARDNLGFSRTEFKSALVWIITAPGMADFAIRMVPLVRWLRHKRYASLSDEGKSRNIGWQRGGQ